MRIMMVLDNVFPPDIRVEKEARTLLKAGHELSLLSLGANGKPGEEVIEGMKVIRTESLPPRMILMQAWDQFRFTFNFIDNFWQKALIRVVEQEQPQVLHIHDLPMVKTGLSVARAFNIPLVADLHENYPEALKAWRVGWKGKFLSLISPSWRWKRLEKHCVHWADRVITVMDEAKEHYVTDCKMSPEEITVVMNTTDLDYFHSLPIEEEIVKKYVPYFTILYIGSIAAHKGMRTAISAMPLILEEIPSALLLLVGKGDEALFKKVVSNKHLDQAVEFVGWQDFALMPSYITASDVCIMPYLASAHVDTSSPHKLFQYMAMAKPMVVSSARPLVRIARETGSGLVYRTGDIEGFAKAIIELHRDKDLAGRLGDAGKKATEEKYNWQNDGLELLKLYESLGGGETHQVISQDLGGTKQMRRVSSCREGFARGVIESVEKVDGWIERNGWAGYDPNDLKGHPFFIWLLGLRYHTLAVRAPRHAILVAADLSPSVSRRLLRIDKQVNAKGMGLLASAYLILHRELGKDLYLKKARECLEWLENNKSQGYAGDCWGYPFNWQSLVLIPRGTPSAVVSAICGDAFWTFYELTGDRKYLSTCESICDFLVNNLNIDNVSDDKICFSYTPVDRFHVHNANLFAAEFLIKVGKQSKREEFYQHGIKALNYTLEAQNEDGSFYYWALSDGEAYNIPKPSAENIDHYHTGFVLRSLHSICKITNEKRACDALSKGYQFYRDNLFKDRVIPKMTPHSVYPVNIHSCSEAILCMSTLAGVFPDALEYAQNTFQWTKEKMQDKDGHFYYLRTKYRTSKIPMIRWGQAWMMRALASLLVHK